MSQNLIETVARTIFETARSEFHIDTPWDTRIAAMQEQYRRMGKAAILATLEAIREPTEVMLTAANREEVGHPWATLAWHAMIDALRAEIEAGN
jgi:hypothetical protein